MSNPNEEVEVEQIPECDVCIAIGKIANSAVADVRLDTGTWANVCEEHFKQYNCKLGLGLGQRFVLRGAK